MTLGRSVATLAAAALAAAAAAAAAVALRVSPRDMVGQAPENRGSKPTAELVGWWVNTIFP